jgi:hypothetical protein
MDYQGHKLPPDETSSNSVQPVEDTMSIRKRLIGLVAMIQSVLFLAHLLLYETWAFSIARSDTVGAFCMKLTLGFLSG